MCTGMYSWGSNCSEPATELQSVLKFGLNCVRHILYKQRVGDDTILFGDTRRDAQVQIQCGINLMTLYGSQRLVINLMNLMQQM